MRAAIISQGSTSSQWTAAAMEKHFDHVDHLLLKDLELSMNGKKLEMLYKGNPIPKYDCVFLKGSFNYSSMLHAISKSLPKETFQPINAEAFHIGHDKLSTHLVLQQHNIPMPTTYLATSETFHQLLDRVNYPIVVKFPSGTGGRGVMFAESKSSASSLLDALVSLKQPFLIQEYIETGGVDIRLFVVGDKVVAGMKRKATPGEKRANLHSGGHGEPFTPDAAMKKIALKTAKSVGAEVCGIDLLEGPTGPLVVEVNLSPGLQGVTQNNDVDVADHIAKYLAARAHQHKDTDKKPSAESILAELGVDNAKEKMQSIITGLDFRSDRILLPKILSKLTSFREDEEVEIDATKDEIRIKRFQ